jgi:hypothetical protein
MGVHSGTSQARMQWEIHSITRAIAGFAMDRCTLYCSGQKLMRGSSSRCFIVSVRMVNRQKKLNGKSISGQLACSLTSQKRRR